MRNDTGKLDQLTSLRFFAAMMIVFHHATNSFGIRPIGVNLGQGVSFFFVLSGFILYYVYPKLATWPNIRQFWRARIARLWPAYAVSLAIGFFLVPYTWQTGTAVATLLMVQAWIPESIYYFSYNAAAWSISTEIFFYLAFPVLLYNWKTNWWIKLLLSLSVLILLMKLSSHFSLPDYGNPAVGGGTVVSQHGLLYINPISRIFEFILGMCVALAWRSKPQLGWNPWLATALEIGAGALCAAAMYYTALAAWHARTSFGPPAGLWVTHSGPAFAFCLLVYVFAQGRGLLSRLLAAPFLVVLGEISFSMYLLHQIFLTYYRRHPADFAHLSNAAAFAVFMAILLLGSYLMWACIEMPGRRLIVGRKPIHATPAMAKSWREHLARGRKVYLAGLAMACIFGFLYLTAGKVSGVSDSQVAAMTPPSLRVYAGTKFGGVFTLRGLNIQCEADGLHLSFAWSSRQSQALTLTNAIHMVDAAGTILGQADYKQSNPKGGVAAGEIWLDSLVIPVGKLHDETTGIAIALYDGSKHLLPIDRGTTDWGGRRLVVPVGKCPVSGQ